jgi:hypothetical protein
MKRRSLALGTSNAEKIPPANKNKRPNTPMINVTGQKRASHDAPVLHV